MWRRTAGARVAPAAVMGVGTLGSVARSRGGATLAVTSPSLCGGAGTFEQAVKDANTAPGKDTIEFTAGLEVDASSCAKLHPGPDDYPIVVTEALDIVGKGAQIQGNQVWIDAGGAINPVTKCPPTSCRAHRQSQSKGFLSAGTVGQGNSGVDVSVSGLSFDSLPTLFAAQQDASLTVTDVKASRINSFNGDCHRSAIAGFTGGRHHPATA